MNNSVDKAVGTRFMTDKFLYVGPKAGITNKE